MKYTTAVEDIQGELVQYTFYVKLLLVRLQFSLRTPRIICIYSYETEISD